MSAKVHLSLISKKTDNHQDQVADLLSRMTLLEKIGQMSQFSSENGELPDDFVDAIKQGRVGSVINEVDLQIVNEMQRLAVEESRLGIPLLIGRDVIHGFKTIFPIPLGQAASWSPELVESGARIGALESSGSGINWTFAPMIDISRDPRWGRIAESLGEDPYLCSILATAMVKGFQGDDLSATGSIAACAKHFAGYGASESGRDYNTTNIPENELRNVYLPPFKALANAGIATFMASFSDLNGVPATGNEWLMNQVLREEWQFNGVLVSDWDSIRQLTVHGFTEDDKEAAFEAANAGIDMEMASSTYHDHLHSLVDDGKIDLNRVDQMVSRILKLKVELGLFEQPYTDPETLPPLLNDSHLSAAKQSALKSCVLLKNDQQILPINADNIRSLAVIGPLADDGYEQLGTWVFDGQAEDSKTCLQAIKEYLGDSVNINYSAAMETSRTNSQQGFGDALKAAEESDLAVLFLGEEAILSGEAHSRSNIDLPGCQQQLIDAIAATGTPIILVVLAGRPLTLQGVVDKVDAILYAWHPGTMGGPAVAELLFGEQSPSGKLPVTFPRTVGQIPLYYAQKNTGRPPTEDSFTHMNDIETRAPQTSFGMTSAHLDTHYSPLYSFGYGLSYTHFEYKNITVSDHSIGINESIKITAELSNVGHFDAEEVVQLYVRDLVGNVTRPVKELKGFQRVFLTSGHSKMVTFELHTDELAFYNRKMQLVTEPGRFHVWIGGSSEAELCSSFDIHA